MMTSDHRPASAALSIWDRSSPERVRAAFAIQKIIQVTNPTATMEKAADQFLGLNEPPGPEGERRAKGGYGNRNADADPDLGQEVAAIGLHQVGDEDADYERGLQAFAQANQEVGQHLPFFPAVLVVAPRRARHCSRINR